MEERMSTERMPNPPDRLTDRNPPAEAQTQATAEESQAAQTQVVQAPPLNEDMANIIKAQTDVIAQRQVYHTQLMFGVSG